MPEISFTYYRLMNSMLRSALSPRTRPPPWYKVPSVIDPINQMAEVLVQALDWNMLSREWNLTANDLVMLHQKNKALLEALKTHLPDRVGGAHG